MSQLWISELTLSHFRSHKACKLALDGRPVALFGPNGAGKTNILEALSLLSPGRGIRRAGGDDLSRHPERLGWKVTGLLHTPSHMHELETWAEPGAGRQVKIDTKAAPQAALGRVARMIWLVPSMDRLWIEGAEGRRRFLDRMTMSFEPSHGEAVLVYEKAMRERNRLLKDMVRDAHWYTAIERQMSESADKIRANRAAAIGRLRTAQAGAETAFPAAELTITSELEIPETVDDLAAAFADNRGADLRAGRTLMGPHRIDLLGTYSAKGVPAAQCSTGEQKALLISLILSNSRALTEDVGAPPIVLLDEVAAHLDQDRRAALYDEISALKAQAFMTGTGPESFDEIADRAQLFEVTEEGGASTVRATN